MSFFVSKSVLFDMADYEHVKFVIKVLDSFGGTKKLSLAYLGFLNFWGEIKHLHHLRILLKLMRKEYYVYYINRFKKSRHNRHNMSLIQRLKFTIKLSLVMKQFAFYLYTHTCKTKYFYYIDINETDINPFEVKGDVAFQL